MPSKEHDIVHVIRGWGRADRRGNLAGSRVRRRIKLGTFAALDQRIALRYAMTGMSEPETKSYLTHHLQLAGRSDTLFSDDAVSLVHQVSRGIPRAVNNLAVQALVAAFATNKTIVDESSARAAVTEVTTE
ncbi:MAG: hypothetical protein ACYDDU_22225 [Dermatophilaceae bacterium]